MIATLLHPKRLVSFPSRPFTEHFKTIFKRPDHSRPFSRDKLDHFKTIFRNYTKLRIRGFFRTRKNSGRTCQFDVECRKALWLPARQALWCNDKRTQASESRSFLCVTNMNCCFARWAATTEAKAVVYWQITRRSNIRFKDDGERTAEVHDDAVRRAGADHVFHLHVCSGWHATLCGEAQEQVCCTSPEWP